MSKLFKSSNGTQFYYNSDLSGIVTLQSPFAADKEAHILGESLLEFIAEYVRMKKISALEQMSFEDILK